MRLKRMLLRSAVIPFCLASSLLVGCGSDASDRDLDTRAVIIGIDSADWMMIDMLIEEGGMPNLASLKERGAWGEIDTLTDIPLSPVIWTSVATGMSPAKHGVTWFMVDQPDGTRVPVRSSNRKTEAIWNIVDSKGLESTIVGWWASYPAEPLEHGTIVSDAVGVHGFGSTARGGDDSTKVSPPELFDHIDSLMPVEQQITAEFALRFMHMSEDEYDRLKFDPARMSKPHPLSPTHLFQQYAVTAQGYTRIGEELLAEDFDLAMLYFEQVDSFSHLFMKYDAPKLEWVDQASYDRYKDLVREWYRYQDELLGRLLAKIDLETTAIFILSDHGFKVGDRRIQSSQTVDIKKAHLDHEKEGIFLAVGPHIRPGGRVSGASVIDITPTVLHYLGLPVGKDMDGKVLAQAFDDEFMQDNPITYVGSYETGARTGIANEAGDEDYGDVEAGLQALGYMGSEDDLDDESEEGESSPELHNNLGRILLGRGEMDEALAEFKKALALDENNAEALLNMARVHQAEGRVLFAQHLAERALSVDPNSVGALAQLAESKRDQGLLKDAVRLYEQALVMNDSQPSLFLGLGDVLQRDERYAEAEVAFKKALGLDPDSFAAHYNLGVTYAQMGRREDAIASYYDAAEKGENHPQVAFVWNNLGALHRDAGENDEALTSFVKAAELSPLHLEARFNAAMIYMERDAATDAIKLFEEAKQIQPNHELVNTWLGLAYLREEQVEDAHRCLLLVRRLHPSNWHATIGLASILKGVGNDAEAEALFEDALREGGEAAKAFAAGFPNLTE